MAKIEDGQMNINMRYIELAKLTNVYLAHFPNREKYALTNNIRNTLYKIYDLMTEGQKRYYKKTTLETLDITHEKLRMEVKLAHELGYFNFKNGKENKNKKNLGNIRYLRISKMIDEVGRMIGGWIKKVKELERNRK